MSLESGSWISDLDSANPAGGDVVSQGDNHLRLIKSVLKNHFPNHATSSGTNTIILTLSPAWTEYKPGVILAFKAGGTNTGAATLNVNGIGAIAVQCGGAALRAGAITADDLVVGVIRDVGGTKTFQLISFNRAPDLVGLAMTGVVSISMSGPIYTTASQTGGTGFRLPHGTAPTGGSLFDGDVWSTTAGVFARINGTTRQMSHINYDALAALSLVSDRVVYANGSNSLALATFTSFGRSLVDDADASAGRSTLGVGSMATRSVTISTSSPSGGSDGDVWFKYT